MALLQFSRRTWLVAFASLQLKNNFGSTCAGILEVKVVLVACLCADATRVDFECFPPLPTLASIHLIVDEVNLIFCFSLPIGTFIALP